MRNNKFIHQLIQLNKHQLEYAVYVRSGGNIHCSVCNKWQKYTLLCRKYTL